MVGISDEAAQGIERVLQWVIGQPKGGSVADQNTQRNAKRILKYLRRKRNGKASNLSTDER